MKIYKPIGSKERLFDVMQKVNKIRLNEDFNQTSNNQVDINAILTKGFQALKNGELSIQGGGSNNTTIQMTDNERTVEINGIDNNKNNYKFIFKLNYDESDQEGVYNVNAVVLKNFEYKSADSTQTFQLDENALKMFNSQYSNELFDIVNKFVDVKNPELEPNDEELEEAIKLIDAMKKDSYPYGGGSDRMQTGKGYADTKPVEPDLRVSAPELEKFVQEEINNLSNINSGKINVAPEKKVIILKAIDNLTKNKSYYHPNVHEIQAEINKIQGIVKEDNNLITTNNKYKKGEFYENKGIFIGSFNVKGNDYNIFKRHDADPIFKEYGKKYYTEKVTNLNEAEKSDYPDVISKDFDPNVDYPKLKKKHKKKFKLGESTDQDKYENVLFLQGEKAYQPLEILNSKGKDAALEYLKQWHYPGEHEGSKELLHGSGDKIYEKDGYIMSWNPGLEYIGLQYDLSKMNEEEIPNSTEIDNTSTEITDDNAENTGSEENKIQQLAKEKEEAGELIQGGVGEGKSPLEFDPDQVLKGIDVEMEHTDNPLVALEIVLDHLTEQPNYYTVKDTPQDSAQQNAATDTEENNDEKTDLSNSNNDMSSPIEFEKIIQQNEPNDEELTNTLLGYEPKNVGDYVESDIEKKPEEIVVNKKEVYEDKESQLKQTDPATWHQIQIAKKTMKMNDAMANILGGMTRDEAREILRKRGIKFTEN